MSYYKLLGLRKEPFSTSPDPGFFYLSREHKSALYRLRTSIELKRGLNLILGDVGTGKTTLSRRLSQFLALEEDAITPIILNPVYENEEEFLADLAERFHIKIASRQARASKKIDYLRAIERFFFESSVEKKKTIIILIDEAQKLSSACLETLRVLLNYETNEYKILQLVLVGQMELLPKVKRMKNFWDRIALKYMINTLEEPEVKELINFRLKKAGYASRYPLFTDASLSETYNYTQGYPRRIAMLCHDALEHLVMHKKEMVTKEVIQELARREIVAHDAIRTAPIRNKTDGE